MAVGKQSNPSGKPDPGRQTPSGSTPSSAPVKPSVVKDTSSPGKKVGSVDGAWTPATPSTPSPNWLSEWLGEPVTANDAVYEEAPITSTNS